MDERHDYTPSEIESFRCEMRGRHARYKNLVTDLQTIFHECSGSDWYPPDEMLMGAICASRGCLEAVEIAIRALAGKEASGKLHHSTWESYFWGCFYGALRDRGMA